MCSDRLKDMPHGFADPLDFLPLNDFLWPSVAWLKYRRPFYVGSKLPSGVDLNLFSIMVSSGCFLRPVREA